MIKKFMLTMLLMLTLSVSAVFASVESLKFNGYVADQAGMFSETSVKKMNDAFDVYKDRTGASIVVVVLKTANPDKLDAIGQSILDEYRIMNTSDGKGVLFLVVQKEELLHVVLGSKLINEITSAQIGELLQLEVVPYMQQGQFDEGIIRGAKVLSSLISILDYSDVTLEGSIPAYKRSSSEWLWLIFILLSVCAGGAGLYRWAKKSNVEI